jgi:hypothetical protein
MSFECKWAKSTGCKFRANELEEIQQHQNAVHRVVKPCSVCGARFESAYEVQQHGLTVHEIDLKANKNRHGYICRQSACGKWFRTQKELVSHRQQIHE